MKTENWKTVRLEDIFDLQMGKTPDRKKLDYFQGSHKWISIADISKSEKYISETKECLSDEAITSSGIKSIPKDTLIMSFKLSIGKTAITSDEMYSNEAIMAFLPNGKCETDNSFLYHLFSNKDWSEGSNKAVKGITLNKASLSESKIPLPPLEEQKHIAAVLDKCTALIAKHKLMLERYDTLIKSRFIEMFGDNPSKNGKWQINELGTLSEIGSSKRIFANEYVSEGIPFYRSKEIRELGNRERPSIELYISYEKYNEIKTKYGLPKKNDILIAAIGATIGYTWIIDTDSPFYYKDGNLILISNIKKLDSIFLNEILKTEIKAYKERASGSAQLALTIEKMEKLQIPVPPIELQNDFAAFVQQIDKSKFVVQKSLEKAEILYKSLMQEYFG